MIDILLPIVVVIAAGFGVAHRGWLDDAAIRGLARLTFVLLAPALLFRVMATTPLSTISWQAPLAYFGAAVPLFAAGVWWRRRRGRAASAAAVGALAGTFSNTVMLGVPLIKLAYGERGLAVLLTIVMLNSLVMLSLATLVLELSAARPPGAGEPGAPDARSGLRVAARASLVNPVILPIAAGVVWSLVGLTMPVPMRIAVDMLSAAAPPMCLVLIGASLARFGLRTGLRQATRFALVKNLLLPLAVMGVGRFVVGLEALPLAVATLAAAMPIGNNVYLLAQRYDVERETVAAGILLSTLACALTLPALLVLLRI